LGKKDEAKSRIEDGTLDVFEGFFKETGADEFEELAKESVVDRSFSVEDFADVFDIGSLGIATPGSRDETLACKGDGSVEVEAEEEKGLKKAVKKAFTEFESIVSGMPMSVKQENFLRAYVKCKNLSKARTIAGVTRGEYSRWVAKETAFAEAVKGVTEFVADLLEDTALEMALSGNEKLLIKMLEAYRPEKFSPKKAIDVSTRSDVNINVNNWAELARKAMEAERQVIEGEVVEEVEDEVLRISDERGFEDS
jgi:hypothetical protein